MGTGACGIDCTVCRLHVEGLCSTCGAGTSEAGRAKHAAQVRLFGQACPVLACAMERGVGHCLRDCERFPCDAFADPASPLGPRYPFSQAYLDMQRRRRAQLTGQAQAAWPDIAEELWDTLAAADPDRICELARVRYTRQDGPDEGRGYLVQCLHETWWVDPAARTLTKRQGRFGGEWDRQVPFPILVYLVSATASPVGEQRVAPRELYPGLDAFQGRNALHTRDFEATFGVDAELLPAVAPRLGGEAIPGADLAFRFTLLPKIPVDYLLWLADEEFPARLTLLLDPLTPRHLPADVCAVLVNLLTQRLLLEARTR